MDGHSWAKYDQTEAMHVALQNAKLIHKRRPTISKEASVADTDPWCVPAKIIRTDDCLETTGWITNIRNTKCDVWFCHELEDDMQIMESERIVVRWN